MQVQSLNRFPDFLRELPEIDLPIPGARGWMIQGSGQQVVFVEFDEGVEVPEHTHAEQWEFALGGKVVLHAEGTSREYLPGSNFFIPAELPHAATVHAGYRAMMVFNSPDRYRAKT